VLSRTSKNPSSFFLFFAILPLEACRTFLLAHRFARNRCHTKIPGENSLYRLSFLPLAPQTDPTLRWSGQRFAASPSLAGTKAPPPRPSPGTPADPAPFLQADGFSSFPPPRRTDSRPSAVTTSAHPLLVVPTSTRVQILSRGRVSGFLAIVPSEKGRSSCALPFL